jgi:hypothetical protein
MKLRVNNNGKQYDKGLTGLQIKNERTNMNLKKQFEVLAKHAGIESIDNATCTEAAMQRLHSQIYAMAGCNDLSAVEVEEVQNTHKSDPDRPGYLLKDSAGNLVRVGTEKPGWVMVMDEDTETFDLYLDGSFKASFRTSSRGAVACRGELEDGRAFRAMILPDGRTEGWKELEAA